jgi:AraC family transcriptional regulator of adaptative response / DNA-3-methyladenine glycosylase II
MTWTAPAGLLRTAPGAWRGAGRRPDAAPHAGLAAPRPAPAGWLDSRFVPERHEVHAARPPSLSPVLGAVLQAVRQMLDLDADPAASTPCWPSCPCPHAPARACPARWTVSSCGARGPGPAGHGQGRAHAGAAPGGSASAQPHRHALPGADPCLPDAATLAAPTPQSHRPLGIVRQRVAALQALAVPWLPARLALHRGAPLQATLDTLRAARRRRLDGAGDRHARAGLARRLAGQRHRPDERAGLARPQILTARAEAWRPWRAYAVMRLWHQLEDPT